MFRNIPQVTKNLLIANILIYLLSLVSGSIPAVGGGMSRLNDIFGLHFVLAPDFHLYQLLTYMFMHANFEHLFFNMFALWMFGCVVENVWGARRFLTYYLICGIGAGLFQEAAQLVQFYTITADSMPGLSIGQMLNVAHSFGQQLNGWTTVGASGAIYAILLAFGMIFPEERIFIFPLPIPIKAKWFVLLYAVIELGSALATTGDNVAHLAHLGGMVFGFFLIRYWRNHPNVVLGQSKGREFFARMKNSFDQHSNKTETTQSNNKHQSDWDYNARKQKEEREIDAILDKIRKSGYDSLTKEEKQRLFDSRN